ncbi:mannonate dehydratase [Actinotignum urinale]|uniref:mannonate dehydratase n=1 Tax=Actinotignum urinale TaxID=190146 RepID=UPI002A8006C3|nr:mannonate dehydratase [Actinotignum urinale]MDY5152130.1 mannonate dehydratase [Actinotignum urinale]
MSQMKMTFRWYGPGQDPITPQYIRQIPGVTGVMATLNGKAAEEVWEKDEIKEMVDKVQEVGLECKVIESVNVHEDIKLGLPTRDELIKTYIKTLENLSEFGIEVVVYNFMPVFDWLRTDLEHVNEDGSTCLYYDEEVIKGMTPRDLVEKTEADSKGLTLPGWEPERLARLDEVMELYKDMTVEKLRENWKYFLDAIMPTCERVGIRMACHPDDPAWNLFGIPRAYKNIDDVKAILDLHESRHHGLCLCIGSMGSNPDNDVVEILKYVAGRDRLVASHLRNVKYLGPRKFKEAAHWSADGDLDIEGAVEVIHDLSPHTYIRPDHGRMIWGEEGRPGYPLYDRALGAEYLLGVWDGLKRMKEAK